MGSMETEKAMEQLISVTEPSIRASTNRDSNMDRVILFTQMETVWMQNLLVAKSWDMVSFGMQLEIKEKAFLMMTQGCQAIVLLILVPKKITKLTNNVVVTPKNCHTLQILLLEVVKQKLIFGVRKLKHLLSLRKLVNLII